MANSQEEGRDSSAPDSLALARDIQRKREVITSLPRLLGLVDLTAVGRLIELDRTLLWRAQTHGRPAPYIPFRCLTILAQELGGLMPDKDYLVLANPSLRPQLQILLSSRPAAASRKTKERRRLQRLLERAALPIKEIGRRLCAAVKARTIGHLRRLVYIGDELSESSFRVIFLANNRRTLPGKNAEKLQRYLGRSVHWAIVAQLCAPVLQLKFALSLQRIYRASPRTTHPRVVLYERLSAIKADLDTIRWAQCALAESAEMALVERYGCSGSLLARFRIRGKWVPERFCLGLQRDLGKTVEPDDLIGFINPEDRVDLYPQLQAIYDSSKAPKRDLEKEFLTEFLQLEPSPAEVWGEIRAALKVQTVQRLSEILNIARSQISASACEHEGNEFISGETACQIAFLTRGKVSASKLLVLVMPGKKDENEPRIEAAIAAGIRAPLPADDPVRDYAEEFEEKFGDKPLTSFDLCDVMENDPRIKGDLYRLGGVLNNEAPRLLEEMAFGRHFLDADQFEKACKFFRYIPRATLQILTLEGAKAARAAKEAAEKAKFGHLKNQKKPPKIDSND